jgi:hypothetical protein
MKVEMTAELTVTTNLEVDLFAHETAQEAMDHVVSEGLQQYAKDFDPFVLHATPTVRITKIKAKREHREDT